MLRLTVISLLGRARAFAVHSGSLMIRRLSPNRCGAPAPKPRTGKSRNTSSRRRSSATTATRTTHRATTAPFAHPYSCAQLIALVTLRMLLGLHLLYAGTFKLWSGGAEGIYLLDHDSVLLRLASLAEIDGRWLALANSINAWGLTIAGAALILGLFGRAAAALAFVLLGGYCMVHLPMSWTGMQSLAAPTLLEAVIACALWLFPTSHMVGADRLRAPGLHNPAAPHPRTL